MKVDRKLEIITSLLEKVTEDIRGLPSCYDVENCLIERNGDLVLYEYVENESEPEMGEDISFMPIDALLRGFLSHIDQQPDAEISFDEKDGEPIEFFKVKILAAMLWRAYEDWHLNCRNLSDEKARMFVLPKTKA